VNVVMDHRIPQNLGNFLISWATVGFSKRSWFDGVSLLVS
jgi:hypothetical protein